MLKKKKYMHTYTHTYIIHTYIHTYGYSSQFYKHALIATVQIQTATFNTSTSIRELPN